MLAAKNCRKYCKRFSVTMEEFDNGSVKNIIKRGKHRLTMPYTLEQNSCFERQTRIVEAA